MTLFDIKLVSIAIIGASLALRAPSAGSSPLSSQPDGQNSGKPIDAASGSASKLLFAPLWIAVPKYPPDFGESRAVVPSASYAMIWQMEWQNELGLSAEQKQALLAVRDKASADIERHTEYFKSLPPEEREAEVESWGGKPSPWRQQLDDEIRSQIEPVLTPLQLQTLKDFSFPIHAVGLLYDAEVRHEIDFGPDQENRFRHVVKERLARFQEEYLQQAVEIWALLNPQQQADLSDVVKRQGPTSAALAVAYHLGFDIDALGLSYPLLAELPVRERLGLSVEQDRQLQAVMADVAVRSRRILQEESNLDSKPEDRQRIEAILTPQQLTSLKEIDFRRKVVLALGYPDKREAIGITDEQTTELRRLDARTQEQLYRIDREMLEKVLEILTLHQRNQLSTEIDRRIGG